MTLWNVELFSVTDALITLKSNSRKIKIREIILKGRSQKYSLGKSLFSGELCGTWASCSVTPHFKSGTDINL